MTDIEERLVFLNRVIQKEIKHLGQIDQKLFAQNLDLQQIQQIEQNPALSEQIDAFVSRFNRLQDTVDDKLLPVLLKRLGEQTGPMLNNLDKAEKFAWVESSDEWLSIRMLRNQMVHEYIEDPMVLHDALHSAHAYVATLTKTAQIMLEAIPQPKT